MAHNEFDIRDWFSGLVRSRHGKPRRRRHQERSRLARRRSTLRGMEGLEDRRMLAILSFDAGTNTLIFSGIAGETNDVKYT